MRPTPSTVHDTPVPPPPTPTTPEPESITVQHNRHCSPWPLLVALTLAAVVGPATAWLLLYASLTAVPQLVVAAAVPVGLGLAAAASTLLDPKGHE